MALSKPNIGTVAQINQSSNKRFIWYFLVVSFLCALPAFILYAGYDNVQILFIFFQIITLIIASFHIYFINEKLGWDEELIFLKKLLFTVGIMICSMLFFYAVCHYLVLKAVPDYVNLYLPSIFVFIIPFFVIATFDKAMQISPVRYKLWFYKENMYITDPDLIDYSNSHLMSFEFPKKYNDTVISNFKFKAPLDIQFAEMFYNYINEYNDAYRESQIEYQDSMSKAYGWLFYIKPNTWWKSKRIIDPHLTMRQNKLREQDVIVPKRFIVE
jgi:hypothetical protein